MYPTEKRFVDIVVLPWVLYRYSIGRILIHKICKAMQRNMNALLCNWTTFAWVVHSRTYCIHVCFTSINTSNSLTLTMYIFWYFFNFRLFLLFSQSITSVPTKLNILFRSVLWSNNNRYLFYELYLDTKYCFTFYKSVILSQSIVCFTSQSIL